MLEFLKIIVDPYLVGESGDADEHTNRKSELPVIQAKLGNNTSLLLLFLCK